MTSRFSFGKTTFEAAIQGVAFWGVVFTILFWMTGRSSRAAPIRLDAMFGVRI
jgi:hypothetical protein